MAELRKDKKGRTVKPAKNKIGRPKIVIDMNLVKKLGLIMCTMEEIAAVLNVSLSTLEHNKEFLRVYKSALQEGRASLRRYQYRMAETNPTMAIWLGKQYLGQKDRQEIDVSGNVEVGDPFLQMRKNIGIATQEEEPIPAIEAEYKEIKEKPKVTKKTKKPKAASKKTAKAKSKPKQATRSDKK